MKPRTQEPVDLATSISSTSSNVSLAEHSQISHPPSPSLSSPRSLLLPLAVQQPQPRPNFSRTLPGSMVNLGAMLTGHPPPLLARTRSPLNPNSDTHFTSRATQPPPLEQTDYLTEYQQTKSSSSSSSSSSLSKGPTNPRDHSFLELIYNETHAARFINLEPFALLTNSIPLYFNGSLASRPLVPRYIALTP